VADETADLIGTKLVEPLANIALPALCRLDSVHCVNADNWHRRFLFYRFFASIAARARRSSRSSRNFCQRAAVTSRFRHPHESVLPDFTSSLQISFSAPQLQRQSQYTRRLGRGARRIAVSRPKVIPVRSIADTVAAPILIPRWFILPFKFFKMRLRRRRF
jgi:hypothetical protein